MRDTDPETTAYRLVRRTWWMPWLIGAAVVPVGAITAVQAFSETDDLPRSTHQVVYEVTGAGKSLEIKYVIDGVNGTETVTGADLPWRKELTLEVGPGLGVVQVMASSKDGGSPISCQVRVDGKVVHQAETPGSWSSVSCSSVIRPGKG